MKIRKIHIKNLKSINDLEIPFDENKHATLLYGNNGVGKTTILEAISLIGHVSSMRRISVPDSAKHIYNQENEKKSVLFEEQATKLNLICNERAFDELKDNISASNSLDKWFADFGERGGAVIRYEIKTELPMIKDSLEFYIYFKQTPYSITQALSQKSSDDVEMNDLFAIVHHHIDRADIDHFAEHFYKHSTHLIKSRNDEVKQLKKACGFGEGANIVSYINTDLNDFGRKNDIRESVKDIFRDFGQEMVGRLGLPFDGGEVGPKGEFRFLKQLNAVLGEVIRDFTKTREQSDMSLVNGERLFEITKLYCRKLPGSDDYEVKLEAKRSGDEPRPLDHMSAGENECFFIFMILLGLPIKRSVILLDEPDLHLTTLAKGTFYKKLFDALKDNGCQVILSTHSLFAYSADRENVERLRVKREVVNKRIIYTASPDYEFFHQLHSYYYRTAYAALRVIEKRSYIAHYIRKRLDRLEERAKLQPGRVAITVNFLTAWLPVWVSALFALINDVFNTKDHPHGIIRSRIVDLFLYGGLIYYATYFLIKKMNK